MDEASARFAGLLTERTHHAVANYAVESDVLLVLFGGIAGGVSMPVFEFFKVTDGYPAKRLFLRDPLRAWYLRGLPGIADSASGLQRALATTISQTGVRRVVFCGASAGGFAALLFGSALGVDDVIAFSPQVYLGVGARESLVDSRWPEQIAGLHGILGAENDLYDLPTRIGYRKNSTTRLSLHVCSQDWLDIQHAHGLVGLPGVSLTEHPDGGHKLVKHLRDSGQLRDILTRALQAPEQESSAAPLSQVFANDPS